MGEHNNVSLAIEECGGLDKIEELQEHPKDQIYNKAYHIVESFFSEQGREDGIVIAESTSDDKFIFSAPDSASGTFSF